MIRHSQPTIDTPDFEIINKVLSSGHLSGGKYVGNLETVFKGYIGTRFAIATNSGTSALHLLFLGMDIKCGDAIIIPSYVCSSLLNAVYYIKAKPIICDVDIENYNLDIKEVKKKLSKKVKAIVLPYMFGTGTDIDNFLELGIPLIEDCAQSLGATYKNKKLGSFGIASIFSFYATKVITTGQGGMILTNHANIFRKAKDLIEYDQRQADAVRYNYKLTDLQAALGLAQLKRVNKFIIRRKQIAQCYNKVFSRCPIAAPIDDQDHIYYRYVIRIGFDSRIFINALRGKGIEAKPPVFKPLHRYLGLNKKLFPNTEMVFKQAISLPIYPSLTDNQARFIAKSVIDLL